MLACTPEDFGWERPTWTRELLCLQMKLEGFPSVAVCTMGRALSRVGARLRTAKPIVLCPWPRDQRLRVLAAIRRLEARASAKEPVLYSDEVDIHLNPKIGRDWMLRGHQRRIVTPGNNEKFYLAGALDVRTGRLHTTGAARKCTSGLARDKHRVPETLPKKACELGLRGVLLCHRRCDGQERAVRLQPRGKRLVLLPDCLDVAGGDFEADELPFVQTGERQDRCRLKSHG